MGASRMSVAVIDDDQDDLEIMEQVIHGLHADVPCHLYIHPKEGVEKLVAASDATRPTHIFIDINMPGLSGDKCLQIFRNNSKFDDVSVIMYSTSMPEKTTQQLMSAGADFVFEKPVRIKDYAEILDAILK
jgi:CheY-like chemotaxis protein